MKKPSRNDPCPCGSGKKYKKCCQVKLEHSATDEINQLIALLNARCFAEVEIKAQQLSRRHPAQGLVWKVYGTCLFMQNKDGLAALQKAAQLLPDDAELYNQLGIVLTARERYTEAETSFKQVLKINPDYIEACYNQSLAYMAQARLADAEHTLRLAIDTKPGYAMAHYGMGLVLKAQGRLPEAETSLQRAVELKPNFSGGHYCLAYLCKEQGRSGEALPGFLRAVEIEPGYVDARIKLGECYAEQGCFAEAQACYRRVLETVPGNIDARFNLGLIESRDSDGQNLAALIEVEQAVESCKKTLTVNEAIQLNFALGRAYDNRGNPERAFGYFLEGCRLKRATFDYDPEQTTARVTEIMRMFDRASIVRLSNNRNPSDVPIFVLGMPRSGTTLVEQIIASHPVVHGAGELPDLMEIATGVIAGPELLFPDGVQPLSPDRLTAMGNQYLASLQRRAPEAHRITDKMPHNFMAIGLIHLMLPNAKIIHVKRNPVDTCLSCFTQLFQGKMEFTYELAELGRYYLDYQRLMEHWREVLPSGAFLDVQYEDIVADQEVQARRLLEYCGLEWNDACLDFHKSNRIVRTSSLAQVRQPIYKSSVERWRSYEKFLGPLFDALGEAVPALQNKSAGQA
jgi:tetratricopeptide (TPR) repeat protein